MPRRITRRTSPRRASTRELPAWFLKLEPHPWVINAHRRITGSSAAPESGRSSVRSVARGPSPGSEASESSSTPSTARTATSEPPQPSTRAALTPSKPTSPWWRRYLERLVEAEIRAYFAAQNGRGARGPTRTVERGERNLGERASQDRERGSEGGWVDEELVDEDDSVHGDDTHQNDEHVHAQHAVPAAPEDEESPRAAAEGARRAMAATRRHEDEGRGKKQPSHRGGRKKLQKRRGTKTRVYHSDPPSRATSPASADPDFPLAATRIPHPRSAHIPLSHRSRSQRDTALIAHSTRPSRAHILGLAKELIALVLRSKTVRAKMEGRHLEAANTGGGGSGKKGGEGGKRKLAGRALMWAFGEGVRGGREGERGKWNERGKGKGKGKGKERERERRGGRNRSLTRDQATREHLASSRGLTHAHARRQTSGIALREAEEGRSQRSQQTQRTQRTQRSGASALEDRGVVADPSEVSLLEARSEEISALGVRR